MKKLLSNVFLGFALSLSSVAIAHDEGHGPKLTDSGQYGGVVSPVVNKKDAGLGGKAALVYKAELVRSPEGKIRVYLYDKDMRPLNLAKVEKTAVGTLGAKQKGKYVTKDFSLTLEGKSFVGQMPTASSKPYNIDVTVKETSNDLLTAFDNLD